MPRTSVRLRLVSATAAAALAASLILIGPASVLATAGGTYTCAGGTIASGSYPSVVVAGTCAVDAGSVTVSGNLTIAAGGVLYAAFSGDDVSVDGNLTIGTNGVLVLGCEPYAFECLDDTTNTQSAMGTVGGNLAADGALAVLVHNSSVGRNLSLDGGGGGVNCAPQAALFGFPAYATFEDVSVTGNAAISGWHSCWLGLFRTGVSGNVNFNDNVVADPDGNEVATNTIDGNLNCSGNSPAPQIGDSGGVLNTVMGKANGQCTDLVN